MLNYIRCYFDMTYEQNYDENNAWEGNVIIEENGFFEGIIKNYQSNSEALIIGIYYKDKFIKMYKFNSDFMKRPYRIDTQCDSDSYEGNFYQMDLFGETACGNCKVKIARKIFVDESSIDTLFFHKKLEYFISQKLDALSRNFYLQKRSELVSLTIEELNKIDGKVDILNKNLMDDKTYYKLTRKIINMFQPKDFE